MLGEAEVSVKTSAAESLGLPLLQSRVVKHLPPREVSYRQMLLAVSNKSLWPFKLRYILSDTKIEPSSAASQVSAADSSRCELTTISWL